MCVIACPNPAVAILLKLKLTPPFVRGERKLDTKHDQRGFRFDMRNGLFSSPQLKLFTFAVTTELLNQLKLVN